MRWIALAMLLLVSACDSYPALREADAAREAQQFIASGDCRLLSVYGLSEEAPGAAFEDQSRLGARPIEGTSDTPGSHAEVRFNMRARKYAALYNEEILANCR